MTRFRFLTAALAATSLAVGMLPTAALARDRSDESAQAASPTTCVSDRGKKHVVCSTDDLLNGIRVIDISTRPPGANMNHHVTLAVRLGPDGRPLLTADGGFVTVAGFTSGNPNWQATLQSAFPAVVGGIVNGTGAALVSNLTSPCKGGKCGQSSPIAIAYGGNPVAVAGSESNAQANAGLAATLKDGGCPTATCH